MYRWVKSGQVARGKRAEAMAYSHEIADKWKKYGVTWHVYLERFGDPTRVAWMSDHESLADIEKAQAHISSDPDYLTLGAKTQAAGLFVEGSGKDTLYEFLPPPESSGSA